MKNPNDLYYIHHPYNAAEIVRIYGIVRHARIAKWTKDSVTFEKRPAMLMRFSANKKAKISQDQIIHNLQIGRLFFSKREAVLKQIENALKLSRAWNEDLRATLTLLSSVQFQQDVSLQTLRALLEKGN